MRRLVAVAATAFLIPGCSGEPAATPAGTSPAAPSASPDEIFADTMDARSPGWREDFAVAGTEGSEREALAILSAKTACSKLEAMPVEDVLLSFLAGELPPDTVGTLVYSATVAYCPSFTEAVQSYADANR